jgi:hypothetical protein
MARLLVKTAGVGNRLIELKLGTNRIGRSEDTDFPILHPTVSSLHCELVLMNEGVILRDLESTNGTFVDGRAVREARLSAGQTVQLGDVELLVETTDVTVAIPKFIDPELPAPPVVLVDGAMVCPRHSQARVTHRCTHCKEVMCAACVHQIRRRGGKKTLLLCPVCGQAVALFDPSQKQKKRSLFARLGETVKMKITRAIRFHSDVH